MKIFDWVHRKIIHTNMDYRKVPRHKKDPYADGGGRGSEEDRGESKKGETEKAALLMDLHHAARIQQALDEILTIGTLGHLVEYQHGQKTGFLDADQLEFLPLAPLASKEEQQLPAAAAAAAVEEADQETKQEEPAVLEAAPASAAAAHPNHHMVVESFKKEMLEILGAAASITGSTDQNGAAGEEGDLLEPLLQETRANRKERVTLADLFMASEDNVVHASVVEPTAAGQKAAVVLPAPARVAVPEKEAKSAATGTKAKPSISAPCRAKSGEQSLTKNKLTPRKKEGEDSSTPPQKLQRVIRRMLKKKIHPAETARVDVNASGRPSTGESASLL